MAPNRVTLQQVADRAGVSRTTASFVLTGRRDMRISAGAQERVMHASRELNYRPSLVARALMNHRSQTIGLISDQLATEVFAGEAIRGALSTALLHEHMLFVGESGGDRELEIRLVQDMLDRGVGGFIYAALYTRKVTLSPLLRGQPVVLLNCVSRSRGFAAVVPDEIEGGRAAAQVLIDAGHSRSIVLVGETPPHTVAGVERLSGIQDALRAANLQLMAQLDTIWWPDEAYHAVSELLASGARPTALICVNDRVAFGAHQAITGHGLTIPDDISIVSFDDSDLASWIRPHLTSIAIPHFELGRRSIELLLDDDRPNVVHRIPMPLFERESVGPPAKRRVNGGSARRHAS